MTFWRVYYHVVWTTKNRAPLIQPEMEERLYSYLISKAAELGVYVYAVNGWVDHVHLVLTIPPKHAIADVVGRLKGASSHDISQDEAPLAWQRGYGVLSLGEKQLSIAKAYVENQKQHHQQQTTNPWLEHSVEVNEGPKQIGIRPTPVPQIMREPDEDYDIWGEMPF